MFTPHPSFPVISGDSRTFVCKGTRRGWRGGFGLGEDHWWWDGGGSRRIGGRGAEQRQGMGREIRYRGRRRGRLGGGDDGGSDK
jgi:hypothetical protein